MQETNVIIGNTILLLILFSFKIPIENNRYIKPAVIHVVIKLIINIEIPKCIDNVILLLILFSILFIIFYRLIS